MPILLNAGERRRQLPTKQRESYVSWWGLLHSNQQNLSFSTSNKKLDLFLSERGLEGFGHSSYIEPDLLCSLK